MLNRPTSTLSTLAQGVAGPAQPAALDWALLALLVAISGSAFAMIHEAVATVPPAAVAIIRLWLGAGLMYAIMRAGGDKFPPLVTREGGKLRVQRQWRYVLAVSVIGYTGPFFIFPWAQQHVESGLAGVYMAFMPLWTLGLAFFFADEKLTPAKCAGFILGFAGVLILMGPDVISGAARSSILAQTGLLIATLGYAISAVIMRRMPPLPSRTFAAGSILGGAIFATPAILLFDPKISEWSISSLLSIVGLAIGPTGIAGLIIVIIIKRAGASFMALANYLVPVWAVIMGAMLFEERLPPRVFVALAVILLGVAISQRRPRAKPAA